MKKAIFYVCLTALALSLSFTFSGKADPNIKPPAEKIDLGPLKQLVGTWTGTTTMKGEQMPITVIYRLSGGGSVLMETLHPNTPMEMVSMYHRDGEDILMTHYCMLGNQPRMALRKNENDKILSFVCKDATGMKSHDEAHMHALTLTIHDENTIEHDWTMQVNGQDDKHAPFSLTRQTAK